MCRHQFMSILSILPYLSFIYFFSHFHNKLALVTLLFLLSLLSYITFRINLNKVGMICKGIGDLLRLTYDVFCDAIIITQDEDSRPNKRHLERTLKHSQEKGPI